MLYRQQPAFCVLNLENKTQNVALSCYFSKTQKTFGWLKFHYLKLNLQLATTLKLNLQLPLHVFLFIRNTFFPQPGCFLTLKQYFSKSVRLPLFLIFPELSVNRTCNLSLMFLIIKKDVYLLHHLSCHYSYRALWESKKHSTF